MKTDIINNLSQFLSCLIKVPNGREVLNVALGILRTQLQGGCEGVMV